jgi:hypothetical protein
MAFKKILFRRDTAANWTSINPTLSIGEIGYETDTGRIKIGNGSSVWTSLEYFVGNLPGASLNDLGDVVISEASDGDFLRWDGTKWINDAVNLSTDTVGNYMVDISGGTGVIVTHTPGESSSASIAIGQDVSTSASVAFGQVTTTGDVVVGGNFTVNGTSTTLNTETLAVEDNIIVLNANTIGSPILNAGIEVERGDSPNVSIRWNESTDKWQITNDGSDYNDVVDLDYLNTKIAEEHYHRSVWLASTTPLSGSPVYTNGTIDEDGGYGIGATLESSINEELVVDGEVPYVGARIGVFGQSNAIENGIYVVTELGGPSSSWVLTRADDANGSFPDQIKRGETIPVAWGETNAIQAFGVSSDGSTENGGHIFGTDEINFIQVSGTAQLIAGPGIEFTGNAISLVEYSSSVVSGSPSFEFVGDVSVDAYGRVEYVERSVFPEIKLGTNTSGNYIETIIAGTGILLSGQNGASASPTIEIAQDVSTSASVSFSHIDVTTLSVSSLLDAPNANFTTVNATSLIGDLEAVSASASNFYGELFGNVLGNLTGNVVGNVNGDLTGNVTGDVTGNLTGNVTGNVSGSATYASLAAGLLQPRTIEISGDVVGSGVFDGSSNVSISAIIQPNSVALGTDTTGNYMTDVSAGTGITITHTQGEGSTATIGVTPNTYDAYGLAASVQSNVLGQLQSHADDTTNIHGIADTSQLVTVDGVQVLTNKTLNSASISNPTITGVSPTIALGGDLSGSLTLTNLSGGTLNATITANSVALGADTTGSYVESLVAGTGVTVTNNSGESATPTVAIGQNVATSASPTFAQVTLSSGPTSNSHAATKEYVDEVAQGLQSRPSVRAASTTNLAGTYDNGSSGVGSTLTATSNGALPAIDGVSGWSQYDGILLKNQTNKAENGRWVVFVVGDGSTPWQLLRCGLCDEPNEVPGSYIFVTGGETNANNGYVLSVDDPATFQVGIDDINVFQFSGAGQIIPGTGVFKDGNVISIGQDVSSSVSVSFSGLKITGSSISINDDQIGAPTLNALIEAVRGSESTVAIRWNETDDKWEITNDGLSYSEITTEARVDELNIDDLADVDLSTPASNGQFLKYESSASAWVAGTIPTINSLDDIGDVSASSPGSGQFLKWDGSSWIADTIVGGATVSTTPPSSPTSGQLWFESDTLKTYVYYDSYWIEIISGSSPASLSDIGNVNTTGLASGDRISYNGSSWVATPVSDVNAIIAVQMFS